MNTDIKSMLPSELRSYFESIGEKPYRAEQTFKWLHGGACSFDDMTDLPAGLRSRLGGEFALSAPTMANKQISAKDGTIKYLWRMGDGNAVESVVMDYEHGAVACISTQVGCRMGCRFCASRLGGLTRNLTASEMEDQVLFSQLDSGKRISNVVMMGIGEPLDNFDNVIRFLRLVTNESAMNISARRISLSTCGIIENIDKLAEYEIKLTLSVSLHAPDDETRTRLMPINQAVGVDNLLRACRRYFEITGRRVSYEYAMIDGINDTLHHARLLAEKLKNTGSHLNLILLNSVTENPFRASDSGRVETFKEVLNRAGINYTIRRRLGSDIDAACGQLRRKSG